MKIFDAVLSRKGLFHLDKLTTISQDQPSGQEDNRARATLELVNMVIRLGRTPSVMRSCQYKWYSSVKTPAPALPQWKSCSPSFLLKA